MPTPILTDKPEPADILANSQVDIQNSFEYLQAALNRDHNVSFNVSTLADNSQGRHNQVSFINNALRQIAVPGGSSGILHESDGSGNPNLYWRGVGMASSVQLSNFTVVPLTSTNGRSFLPSPGLGTGIMIQWGQSTTTNAAYPAAPTVLFSPAFSAPPFSIQVSILQNIDAGKLVQVATFSATQFQVTTRDSGGGKVFPITYSWIAIGPS